VEERAEWGEEREGGETSRMSGEGRYQEERERESEREREEGREGGKEGRREGGREGFVTHTIHSDIHDF
jgi:hypothetical protein